MESHLLSFVALLLLAVVAVSHAALSSEVYWDTVLPNTPMPKAVREMLRTRLLTDPDEEKSTSVSVGKGGIVVNSGKPGGKGTSVNVGGKGGVNVNTGKGKQGGGTNVNVGGRKGGVHVGTGKPGGRTNVNVGKGGVNVHTGRKGKPVIVGVRPGYSPFNYVYAATEDQLHEDPNVALFFLEKDLHQGSKMNLHFTRSTERATFLPRQLADAIPFTSDKLADVMEKFSVEPQSLEAEEMKQTIKQCEEPAQEGEEKYCATSLESMVDFTVSKLGKQVLPISTEVDKEETVRQQYTIGAGVKKMGGENSIACHSQTYAYAVFYCHETHSTKAYKVPLVGADGTKATAVAVCHTDTSKWNPKHLAFQVLKVKPGTVPVCHFLPEDHIVWTSN